jgi:hypothetical protein
MTRPLFMATKKVSIATKRVIKKFSIAARLAKILQLPQRVH